MYPSDVPRCLPYVLMMEPRLWLKVKRRGYGEAMERGDDDLRGSRLVDVQAVPKPMLSPQQFRIYRVRVPSLRRKRPAGSSPGVLC